MSDTELSLDGKTEVASGRQVCEEAIGGLCGQAWCDTKTEDLIQRSL